MATSSNFDVRLTYADLVRLPDDGQRHEIINGVHYVTPSPALRHQRIVGRLLVAIQTHLDERPGAGEVFVSPVDTVFSPSDVVVPDLVFVAAEQAAILTDPNIQGPPALVVEVLSPGTRQRDLRIKKDLFDRGGVLEYWIVDPASNTISVYRRAQDGSFPQVQSLTGDAALTTPVLPKFSIRLETLFRA